RADVAASLHYQAELLLARGQVAKAKQVYTEVIREYEELVRLRPSVPAYRKDLAVGCMNLSNAEEVPEDILKAEAPCRRSVQLFTELARDYPRVHLYQSNVAAACSNLGTLYVRVGRAQ